MANGAMDSGFGIMAEHPDSEELDNLRTLLAEVLIRNTDMDEEQIMSMVFRSGKHIIWH